MRVELICNRFEDPNFRVLGADYALNGELGGVESSSRADGGGVTSHAMDVAEIDAGDGKGDVSMDAVHKEWSGEPIKAKIGPQSIACASISRPPPSTRRPQWLQ